MGFYFSPGIYPKETDLSQIVTAVSSSVGAVVGASLKGPVGERTLITNVRDFISIFGEPDPSVSYMHYSAISFLTVARTLYVTRVVGSGATHGALELTSTTPGSIAPLAGLTPVAPITSPTYTFQANGTILVFAIGPGAYASTISCQVSKIDTVNTPNRITLDVFETVGGVKSKVESWLVTKSKALDGFGSQLFCEDVINGKSKYIRVLNNSATSNNPFIASTDAVLTLGVNGSAPSSGDLEGTLGWQLYNNPDDVNVNILLAGGNSTASTAIVMDGIAQGRRDAMAILNMPSASQTGSAEVTYRNTTLNLNSSYSALYTPDLLIHDPYTNRDLYVPPDGYVGAVYALTDFVADPWKAPAGLNRGLVNSLGLRINYTLGQRDLLYSAGINFFRNIPGNGIAIWGQKTLRSVDSALGRVNVRRLMIVIEKSVAIALNGVAFENNNLFTRMKVVEMVDSFMRRIKARQGVYDYRVVCDDTNNSSNIIDANELHVDIYVQPQKTAEFIQLQTIITRTGANFSELIATGGAF